jgi:hypothetical protein
LLVGIDFSIISTALTIEVDAVDYFYVFYRNDYPKKRNDIYTDSKINFIKLSDSSFNDKLVDSNKRENMKVGASIECANSIVEVIKSFNLPFKVGIETFSYGSFGNMLFDLVGFQYVLRSKIFEMENLESFNFFSPTQVKKIANVNKEKKKEKKDIIQYYKELNVNNALSEFLNDDRFGGKNYKPMDDLVDSYYVKELVKELVK